MATENPTNDIENGNRIGIRWALKGYHVFHIRPPVNRPLLLQTDAKNRYDWFAISVYMPAANDLPVEYAAFGGRQVGRIPANRCRSFCFLQNRGLVLGDISVMYVGEVGQSTRPPVHTMFRTGGQGHLDQAGDEQSWKRFIIWWYPKTDCWSACVYLRVTLNEAISTALLCSCCVQIIIMID